MLVVFGRVDWAEGRGWVGGWGRGGGGDLPARYIGV